MKEKNPFDIFKDMLNDSMTKTEFLKAYKTLIEFVVKIEKRNGEEFNNQWKKIDSTHISFKELSDKQFTSLKSEILKKLSEVKDGYTPIKGKDYVDGENGYTPVKGVDYFDGENGKDTDLTSEEIRNRLEMLTDEERLDISAIKGFEEKIKDLEEQISRIKSSKGGGTGGMNNIARYEVISGQCNGITKTFNVPRHRFILGLRGTQFPITYAPGIDFTTANTILTLTSQVSAPETGQTLIFEYIK